MRALAVVVVVGIAGIVGGVGGVGCWRGSAPVEPAQPPAEPASHVSRGYGGASYGGASYGYGGASYGGYPPLPGTRIGVLRPSNTGLHGGRGLSAQDISLPIRTNAAAFRKCYEDQLASEPQLSGKLTLKFTISGRDGRVIAVSPVGLPEVATCAVGVLWQIRFPAPTDGNDVQVSYPFVFQASP